MLILTVTMNTIQID